MFVEKNNVGEKKVRLNGRFVSLTSVFSKTVLVLIFSIKKTNIYFSNEKILPIVFIKK